MKKFLAMLLALVMALSLVACGTQADTPANDDNTPSADDTAQTETVYAVEGHRSEAELRGVRRGLPQGQ